MMRTSTTFVAMLWMLMPASASLAQERPDPSPAPPGVQQRAEQNPAAGTLERVAPGEPQNAEPASGRQDDIEHRSRDVLRIGQDYTLMPGDATSEIVVVAGNVVIEGHVDHDVVVVLGRTRLGSTATIGGSLVSIGGGGTRIDAGAKVSGDLVTVGSRLDAPAQFTTGGEQIVIGSPIGGLLEGLVPWVGRGLLWGRLIVPNLAWVWGVLAISFFVYLLLSMVFHQPVHATADTLAEKPFTAFVTGLLVLILAGPVCLLLVVSIAGIAVVPFVLCALLLAWILGKAAVARWIGRSVVHQESSEDRLQSLRSFVIGFVLIAVAYMVPLLGLVTWTTIGVFGLGGATLAFVAAYRRENPAPVRVPAVVAVPPSSQPLVAAGPPALVADPADPPRNPPAPAMAVPSGTDLLSFPRAPFRDRLAAFVLDVILVVIAQQLLELTRRDSSFFLLLLVYHIGFWTWKTTTVGGIICQLRVVRVDGTSLRFVDALVRGLSGIFSLAVVGLGALWILKDPDRQAWHDKIAGTYVVKVPRNWPL